MKLAMGSKRFRNLPESLAEQSQIGNGILPLRVLRAFCQRRDDIGVGDQLIMEDAHLALRLCQGRRSRPYAPEFGLRQLHPEQQNVPVPLPTDSAPVA